MVCGSQFFTANCLLLTANLIYFTNITFFSFALFRQSCATFSAYNPSSPVTSRGEFELTESTKDCNSMASGSAFSTSIAFPSYEFEPFVNSNSFCSFKSPWITDLSVITSIFLCLYGVSQFVVIEAEMPDLSDIVIWAESSFLDWFV